MPLLLAIIVIVALLAFGASLVALSNLLLWLLAGLVIGAIARLLLPGRQAIGLFWTALLGGIGGIVGGLLAVQAFHLGNLGQFILSVIVAMVLIALAAGARTDHARI